VERLNLGLPPLARYHDFAADRMSGAAHKVFRNSINALL
jgi:hypothetical protein